MADSVDSGLLPVEHCGWGGPGAAGFLFEAMAAVCASAGFLAPASCISETSKREGGAGISVGSKLCELLPCLYHSSRRTQLHSQLDSSPTKLLQKHVSLFFPAHCQSLPCSARCFFAWSWSSPRSPGSPGMPFQMERKCKTEMSLRAVAKHKNCHWLFLTWRTVLIPP